MFSDNENLKKTADISDKVQTGVIYAQYIVSDFASFSKAFAGCPLITDIKCSAVFIDTIYEKRNP